MTEFKIDKLGWYLGTNDKNEEIQIQITNKLKIGGSIYMGLDKNKKHILFKGNGESTKGNSIKLKQYLGLSNK